jgi:hypothetical protein
MTTLFGQQEMATDTLRLTYETGATGMRLSVPTEAPARSWTAGKTETEPAGLGSEKRGR